MKTIYALFTLLSIPIAFARQTSTYSVQTNLFDVQKWPTPVVQMVSDSKPTSTISTNITATSTGYYTSDDQYYVEQEAISYGVNPNLATCILYNESQWQKNRVGDITSPTGISVGPWQIHLSAHPDVTYKQAMDLHWSTDWALNQIANGKVGIWSTYWKYCQGIPVLLSSSTNANLP